MRTFAILAADRPPMYTPVTQGAGITARTANLMHGCAGHSRPGLYHVLRPLLVGIVHGLAGSAAVALLVLSTVREPTWAMAYLLVFGVGTVAGMMLITAAMALPFSFVGNRFAWLNRCLVIASGLLSFGFGLLVSCQIGFLDGLFTSHPNWNPK